MIQLPATAAIEYVAAGLLAGGIFVQEGFSGRAFVQGGGLLSGGSFVRGSFARGTFFPGGLLAGEIFVWGGVLLT